MYLMEVKADGVSFRCIGKTKKECYDHFWEVWQAHCEGLDLCLEDSMFPTQIAIVDGLESGEVEFVDIKSLPICLADHEVVRPAAQRCV